MRGRTPEECHVRFESEFLSADLRKPLSHLSFLWNALAGRTIGPVNISLLVRNSRRDLCVLCVSAVEKIVHLMFHRRDAENAETAQRRSFNRLSVSNLRRT